MSKRARLLDEITVFKLTAVTVCGTPTVSMMLIDSPVPQVILQLVV